MTAGYGNRNILFFSAVAIAVSSRVTSHESRSVARAGRTDRNIMADRSEHHGGAFGTSWRADWNIMAEHHGGPIGTSWRTDWNIMADRLEHHGGTSWRADRNIMAGRSEHHG